MKKKALGKDIRRTIWQTMPRFLSIFFIVALGVAFFSGVRATKPDMRLTADHQFDQSSLMDIQTIGTMGLTKKDVKALKNLSKVEDAEGSYSVDVINRSGKSESVLKILAATGKMNQITVLKGRMPKKSDEVLIDSKISENTGLKIGDTLHLFSGTDKKLDQTIKQINPKVVGIGNSAYYLSRHRGSTTIGSGQIDGFAVVTRDDFKLETYTDVYITAKSAKAETAYLRPYKTAVKKTKDQIKGIANERCVIRQQEIKDKAFAKIKKKEDKYKKKKKKIKKKLSNAKEKLDDAEEKIDSASEEIDDNEQKLSDAKSRVSSGWETYHANREKLAQTRRTLSQREQELKSAQRTLNAAQRKLQSQIKEAGGLKNPYLPSSAKKKFKKAQNKIDKKQKKIDDGTNKLNRLKTSLNNKASSLNSGKQSLEDKETEIQNAQDEIDNAKDDLSEARSKFVDQRKKYRKARKKANQKFKKAEKNFRDARADVEKIKEPKWHILTRSSIQSYVEYGEDANRIGAIGEVFPLIFFLVAALVSLTTMTRLIEEQRLQMGILKALGYTGFDIGRKYVIYALTATAGGSVLGAWAGEYILPQVIIKAYSMMYTGIRQIQTPFQPKPAFMATGAALAVVLGATLIACQKSMRERPAHLMRPEAPKEGKRILLEHMGVIWNRLSFIWKSTLRNLFRYKKRFLMTVIGIGGCMALLLVGFGLRDSIYSISANQFKKIVLYDMSVKYDENITDVQRQELSNWMQKDKSIQAFLPVFSGTVEIEAGGKSKEASLIVPEEAKKLEELIHFRNRTSGKKYHLNKNEVIVSEKVARLLNIKRGSVISIKEDGSRRITVSVKDVTENYMEHYVYMSPELYAKMYGRQADYNYIFCKTKKLSKKQETVLGRQVLAQNGGGGVRFISETKDTMNDMLANLNVVVLVLIVSAGLLAFVVLYNLNQINIAERRVELATIKVLGFYDLELAAYVYRESMILTLIGTVAGAAMGVFLHRYVILTAEVDAIMFGRDIFPVSFLYSVLITFGFAVLINVFMFFQLKRISMTDSLKGSE